MADLEELLGAAADPVTAAPDLHAIEVRARALRRREVAARAAVVAVVLAAVPVLALARGSSTESLRQADPDVRPAPTAAQETSSPVPQPSGVASEVVGGAARPEAPGAAREPAADPAPRPTVASAAPRSRPTPSSTPVAGDHPPAPSCRLTTRDLQTDARRSCRFTATREGGWSLTRGAGVFVGYDPGSFRVLVVRGDVVVHDSDDGDSLCADAVIRVGDRVTLELESNPNNYADVELGAGQGYGC